MNRIPELNGVDVELYESDHESHTVSFDDNLLKEVSTRQYSGKSVRTIENGHVGFVKGSAETPISEMINEARKLSAYIPVYPLNFPNGKGEISLGTFDPVIDEYAFPEMISTCENALQKIRKSNDNVMTSAQIVTFKTSFRIRNSNHLDTAFKNSQIFLVLGCKLIREGDFIHTHEYRNRIPEESELDLMVAQMADEMERSQQIETMDGGSYPVIVHPKAMEHLLIPLVRGFNGSVIFDGSSPLRDRFGEQIADSRFTLIDDPTWEKGMHYYLVDDEGIETAPNYLIKNGVLTSCLLNLEYANRLQREPTGNGRRDQLASPPGIGKSNWRIDPGESSFQDLVSGIREGLLLTSAWDILVGHDTDGEFSGIIQTGFKIKNGKIGGRVKNMRISGNVYDMLKNQIAGISAERPECYGNSFQYPYILFKDVTIT